MNGEIEKPFSDDSRTRILDDDQILIQKILNGSKPSFEELMQRYNRKIFTFIQRMVRNEDEAIELTQEFFIKIYQVLEKYNYQYKFSTWAYRICYNLVIDHIRRNQTTVDSLDSGDITPRDIMLSENYVKEDGFQFHFKGEMRSLIWNLVDQIPVKLKEVILLRYLHDLKYEEIAEITNLPVGTVKNRIFKAKGILKQEIESHGLL